MLPPLSHHGSSSTEIQSARTVWRKYERECVTISPETVPRFSYDSQLQNEKWTTVTMQQIIYPGNKRNSSREIKGSWTQPQFHTECTWKSVSKGNKHRQRSTPWVQDKQVPHGELDTTQTHSENLSKHRSTRRIQAQEQWINRPAAVSKYPVQLTLQRTERESWLYVSFCKVDHWIKQKVRTRLWIQCMLPLKCQLLHHPSLHRKKR